MTIMTKYREPVKKIALGRAGWCYVQGSRGGEYIVSNANGKLIVMKPGNVKIIKATKELKAVLYTDILVDDTLVMVGSTYEILEYADRKETAEDNTLQESDCDKETTKAGNFQEMECKDTLTEKERAAASLLPVVEAYETALRSKYHSVILYKNAENWNAETVGVNPVKREWATLQDKEKALHILTDHRDAVLINGFENGLGDECNTLEVTAGLLYWEYTTQAHSLSRLISWYTLAKETVNAQESEKERATTGLDEEKIMERINAMPIEELVEIVKKSFEDSHIPYTIEEGGKILFSGIFTDKSRSPPNEE